MASDVGQYKDAQRRTGKRKVDGLRRDETVHVGDGKKGGHLLARDDACSDERLKGQKGRESRARVG